MFALENADKLFHFLDRLKPYKIMSLFFGGGSFCWLFFFFSCAFSICSLDFESSALELYFRAFLSQAMHQYFL